MRALRSGRFWAAIFLLPLLVASGGCLHGVRSWRHDIPAKPPRATVLLLWVDGLDPDAVHELLAHDRLPNIRHYLVDEGAEFVNSTVSLPAITYVNAASLFTGCYPDKTGIYGDQWLDRSTLQFRDYDSPSTFALINRDIQCPTIYERLSDYRTISVQCHTCRGATEAHNGVMLSGMGWLLGQYEWVNRRAADEALEVIRRIGRSGRWPGLMTVYFPGVDAIAHHHGADSARYASSIESVDRDIGLIFGEIEKAAPAGPMYTFLVTDHGQVCARPDHRVALVRWLRAHRKLRVCKELDDDDVREQGREALRKCDAIAIRDAGRRMVLHVRGDDWRQRPAPRAIRDVLTGDGVDAVALWDAPGVDIVCYKGDDGVHVRSRRGHAVIRKREQDGALRYRCELVRGQSPLGLAEIHGDDRGWLTAEQWLRATFDGPYPNAVPQLSAYFESPRAGDILIFAADGWLFDPRKRDGHGAAAASDTRVSMFVRGPGIAAGRRTEPIRMVDIAPTIYELVTGRDGANQAGDAARFDGRSLAPLLRSPTSSAP